MINHFSIEFKVISNQETQKLLYKQGRYSYELQKLKN